MNNPLLLATALALAAWPAFAQRPGPPPPPVKSPEVSAERRITARLRAPEARSVAFSSGDVPGLGRGGAAMSKGEDGVWSVTLEPVESGAYRYNFSVDGLSVVDPANPSTSESNGNTWSLVYVPGSEAWDTKDVPHGAVAEVTYHSKSLGRARRMHVYTPPGYDSGEGRFPVLYLLHGAFDCDDSWTTVGRAGFILDNLIAAGKAKPMVVVMPAGHTGPFRFGPPGGGGSSFESQMKEFMSDFVGDIRPHVESRYRLHNDRAHRAVAGLSMGGAQSIEIALGNLKDYSALGVFSSGVFGIERDGSNWETEHLPQLDDAAARDGLKLVWFATGKEDFLLRTSVATVEVLKKHGFPVTYHETDGGHTWLKWRDYLHEFLPLLFQ
jgi:enterochelin esterase family protein